VTDLAKELNCIFSSLEYGAITIPTAHPMDRLKTSTTKLNATSSFDLPKEKESTNKIASSTPQHVVLTFNFMFICSMLPPAYL
jgi:hypothetical protein